LGYLISTLLIATLAVPFWIPYQHLPIPSFYQEWLAGALALLVTLLVAIKYRQQSCAFPAAAWIPLALLPSVLIHLVTGPHVVLHPHLFHLMWISLALLLMLTGSKLATLKLPLPLADLIAGGLLLGSLGTAVFEIYVRMHGGPGNAWAVAGGILGQRNHDGLHLWLGVLGASQLFLRHTSSRFALAVGAAILVEAAVAGGSRSIYLYAIAGLILSSWAAYRAPDRQSRHLFLTVGIAPIFLLIAVIGLRQWMPATDAGGVPRLAAAAVSQDARIGIWIGAWRIMGEYPILGAGPGTFIRESWLISATLPPGTPNSLPTTHAHNLFLQLGAELGWPTTVAVHALLAYWLAAALRDKNLLQRWIFIAAPLAVLTHNQVEFSLWYLTFLVPTALCMGAVGFRAGGPRFGGQSILLCAATGAVLFLSAGVDYFKLGHALGVTTNGRVNPQKLLDATADPLFGAYASSEVAAYLPMSDENIQFHLKHLQRALYVTPLPMIVPHRYAAMLEKLGRHEEAGQEKLIAERQIPGSWPVSGTRKRE